jgi:DNA polymerase-3 subunit alpha
MGSSFVHLHNHTEYSMLDGAAKITPMLSEAQRLEMPAIGMTDHGNMYGSSDFYKQAVKTGIKPIIGIEAYVAPEHAGCIITTFLVPDDAHFRFGAAYDALASQ